MSLLTVRLSSADEMVVKSLRANGVPISDLVRDALRTEHERRRHRPLKPKDVRALIAEIEAANPIPADAPRTLDTLDRKAVREFIASRLKRKRRN